jgi:translation initiation factor 2 subunit 2
MTSAKTLTRALLTFGCLYISLHNISLGKRLSILERYETLLDRAYSRLQLSREAKPIDLPDVDVEYAGNKTVIKNLQQISQRINRNPRILARYFLKGSALSGAITPSGALEIYGKVSKRSLQELYRRFIQTYVRCPTCGSIDTDMSKRGKIWIIKCLACGAESTVEAI